MKIPEIKINFIAIWRLVRRYILRKKPVTQVNFGLVRDKPDPRDQIYRARVRIQDLPESTDMKNLSAFPWRYDQGALGSCVGNGVVETFRRVLQVNNQQDLDGSRLFAYYNARTDDCKGEDCGASIRDGIKGLNKYGLCREDTWKYITGKFAVKPPEEAFAEGEGHQVIHYERIYPATKEAIMDAVSRGYPVVYGKILYESFMTDKVKELGIVPYPKTCREEKVGGHCMVIFDYEKDYTIELNSWGKEWGLGGACRVPWKYVLNKDFCFDFWTIYLTE
jgi:C1A family cysteine protease